MALIQTSLIWVAYAVVVAILIIIAALFVYMYQQPRERAVSVSVVCIFTVSALLATILLLPVDVALVSSTVSSRTGLRKEWAGQKQVDNIVLGLQIVYYALYSLDALLCLLAIPFTYFFYEEYDDAEAAEGSQTFASRFWGAAKYTIVFVLLCLALFLVGFFLPVAALDRDRHHDLDYFKRLLTENRGERALTFAIGLLLSLGTLVYVIYTAAGMALIPVIFVQSAPSVSAPDLAATTQSELQQNRERQHQLEGRNEGAQEGLNARDRRELEALVREERTLVRRERLAADTKGEGSHWLMRAWMKVEAVFRPLKLIGGILLLIFGLLVFASMLVTGIDKAKNSICGAHCGYVLGQINVFQPLNYIFVQSAKAFPVDYALFLLLVLFFFSASVVGIASVGIRFLWISLFTIRKGKTSPQALLLATELLALMVFAINYAMAMIVAPQYATWGTQSYCDRASQDCASRPELIKPCSELADNKNAGAICTPSVVSTFINRMTFNFPFFGVLAFWAQFAFLGVYLLVLITAFIRTPKIGAGELDQDLEDEEEEGLLATTGRRFNATWHDITGRARSNNPGNYGATGAS